MRNKSKQIRELNKRLRSSYADASQIVHGEDGRTHLTTSSMPNNGTPGRIFAGDTAELIREMSR